jgi:hypothetical protein
VDSIVIFRTIVTLDDILPLIFELRATGIVSRPIFVAWNRQTFEFIKKNVVLYDGIHELGGRLTCLGKYRNRYLNQLYNLFILRKYLYRRILTIETWEVGNLWLTLLSRLNRKIWKGRIIKSLIFNRPFRMAKNVQDNYRVLKGLSEVRRRTVKDCDVVLLSHTKEQHEEIYNERLVLDCPLIQVGYTRGLTEWQTFLNRNIDRYLSDKISPQYFFFVLTYMGTWQPGEDCLPADELLRECLLVMKEFNDEILTVFKPHQNTEMDKFQEILDAVGYRNYVISYEHPLVLMKRAKFTFSYTGSSVLIDAYFSGCPTVEYAHYDSRFFEFNQGRPRYLESVDFFIHRDRAKLREVLIDLIRKDIHVERDPKKIGEDFPVMTREEVIEKFSNHRREGER